MREITGGRTGIEQGSVMLFSDFEEGGAMWTGTGPRAVRRRIAFSRSFRAPPAVMVAISMWDFDRGTNQRADLSAEAIDAAGFDMVFRTWGDTRVARIRADWTAIGELPDPDDWDLC